MLLTFYHSYRYREHQTCVLCCQRHYHANSLERVQFSIMPRYGEHKVRICGSERYNITIEPSRVQPRLVRSTMWRHLAAAAVFRSVVKSRFKPPTD
nr:unnamed protein product [Callosobruchus analis]